MEWDSFLTPEWISALSQAATALVATVAAAIAWTHIMSGRRGQREATANALYSEQLRIDLGYPDLAHPDLNTIIRDGKYNQYNSYVSHLFWACQDILETSRDRTWKIAVLNYLALHADFIKSPHFNFGEGAWSPRMVKLFKEAVQREHELLAGLGLADAPKPSFSGAAKVQDS